tara:strand:- start:208 stop:642 length:435 start_codon:yes stop_codon:yes gene_type:complete
MSQLKIKVKFMLKHFSSKKYKIFENCSLIEKFIFNRNNLKDGFIYTLYSDNSNLIEVGFTYSNKKLENKLIHEKFILLDKKKGSLRELRTLKRTLEELGLFILNNKYYKYTELLIRHLHTLGWPVGRSIYKQRVIKKKIHYAIN